MANYLINRIDYGGSIGYKIYVSETKEIYLLTENRVKNLLTCGNRVYGFRMDAEGNLKLDQEGFHTRNIMIESRSGKLHPWIMSGVTNEFYVVVAVHKRESGIRYEVVSSRYGRTCISESRVRALYEIGSISGGIYLDKEGKLIVCEGVEGIRDDQ